MKTTIINTSHPSSFVPTEVEKAANDWSTILSEYPFESRLRGVRNSANPALSQSQQEQRSAKVITNFMRKVVAAQSYGKMFINGQHFIALKHHMNPTVNKRMSFSVLEHLDMLSKHYLNEIKEKTPNLTNKEKNLLAKIIDTKIVLRHQSNSYLAKDGKVNIYSNDKLIRHSIAMKQHTLEEDKIALSNHDFVFFGVEFSEDEKMMPLSRSHQGSDYGARAYLLQDKYPHGYLTLTDHFDNNLFPIRQDEHAKFKFQFPLARRESFRTVHAGECGYDVPLYNAKDMKMGLGLHVVNFLRESKDENLKKFAFKNDLNSTELHYLIHLMFQPEFHLPRGVSTRDYHEVKLRDISLEDAVGAFNFERLSELLTSKNEACKAMKFAVKASKRDVVDYLFERFQFTREDVPLMKAYKFDDDLIYTLSGCKQDPEILYLFLIKDLIDVNARFETPNRGDTMLDNAIKYRNKNMKELLRSYGGMTKKELKALETRPVQ